VSLDIDAVTNGLTSHAMASGWFDRVNGHEPKSPPGYGLTAAFWNQNLGPVAEASGLATTTGRLIYMARLYQNALSEPADAIDPNLIKAADVLFTAYSGDFELGGNVRNIDLLGQHGQALTGQAGYITVNQTMYRIYDITIPVIVNDLWSQSG
jgi:hypothetical protein